MRCEREEKKIYKLWDKRQRYEIDDIGKIEYIK